MNDKDLFLKGHWEAEDVIFYLHFKGQCAIRQKELHEDRLIKLDTIHTFEGDSMLYDQNLDDLERDSFAEISEDEFNEMWDEI